MSALEILLIASSLAFLIGWLFQGRSTVFYQYELRQAQSRLTNLQREFAELSKHNLEMIKQRHSGDTSDEILDLQILED